MAWRDASARQVASRNAAKDAAHWGHSCVFGVVHTTSTHHMFVEGRLWSKRSFLHDNVEVGRTAAHEARGDSCKIRQKTVARAVCS